MIKELNDDIIGSINISDEREFELLLYLHEAIKV